MGDDVKLTPEGATLAAIRDAVDEINRHTRAESDRVYAQIEALMWLRDMLKLDRPLPPLRGWAASPDVLVDVANRIADTQPQVVVEMGSGTSTIAIAACLRRWGGGRLYSLEHDNEHAERTRVELDRHGLSELATVLAAPLGDVDVDGQKWVWYTVPWESIPQRVDMLFVDGPPVATWDLARYPAVPLFRDRLAPRVAVYLDDGIRDDEREIAARWAREDPRFRARELPSEKKAWLLTRDA